jgi:hypothetical protein
MNRLNIQTLANELCEAEDMVAEMAKKFNVSTTVMGSRIGAIRGFEKESTSP